MCFNKYIQQYISGLPKACYGDMLNTTTFSKPYRRHPPDQLRPNRPFCTHSLSRCQRRPGRTRLQGNQPARPFLRLILEPGQQPLCVSPRAERGQAGRMAQCVSASTSSSQQCFWPESWTSPPRPRGLHTTPFPTPQSLHLLPQCCKEDRDELHCILLCLKACPHPRSSLHFLT